MREHNSSTGEFFTKHLVLFQVFETSLICASLGSDAKLRTICDALILLLDIFGIRLLFSKKFVMAVFTKDYSFRNFPKHSKSFGKFWRLVAQFYNFCIWFRFINVILGDFFFYL